MTDYISREAFQKACDSECEKCREGRKNYPEDDSLCYQCVLMDVMMEVKELPSADVREAEWIPFETRPMDEEERAYYSEQYGFALADEEAVIYCSQMPDDGQEVLVCNKYGHIWLDIFDDDPDYGVGFETNGDMDGLVAWMPLPKPYQPPNCGADMREEQT